MAAFEGKADMWLKQFLLLAGYRCQTDESCEGLKLPSRRVENCAVMLLNARIVPRLHWPSTAIMTLRAAACRLAISGR
jgi:hypothetical protein